SRTVQPSARPSPVRTTSGGTPRTSSTPSPQWTSKTFSATLVLHPGQSVASDRTTLALRADGNLVVVDENGVVRWSSKTAGPNRQAVFQNDGNLVVYDSAWQTLWSTRTDGHNGAELVLAADGNVLIRYGTTALWQTGTAH
ncbi:MAG TPA: hypothetical protein VIW71_24430, partial [Streptomyces sp.]